MPPKKKVTNVVINEEINKVLTKHFGGEISLIKGPKLTGLYDDGLITTQMFKYLKKVKQLYSKSENGDIELKITYEKPILDKKDK